MSWLHVNVLLFASSAIPLGLIVVPGDSDLETCREHIQRLQEVRRQALKSFFVIIDWWDNVCQVRFLQTLPSIFRVHLHILSFHLCRNLSSVLFYAPIFLSRTSALSTPSNTWNCRFVVGCLNLYCGNMSAQRHTGKEKTDNTSTFHINWVKIQTPIFNDI